MQRTPSLLVPPGHPAPLDGSAVPVPRTVRHPVLLAPAARKAIRQRMLLFRQASLDRIATLTGATASDLKRYRHDLSEGEVPDLLLQRGASLPFTRELPQGALLYLVVRALRPRHVVETGVRPGYSTAWILAGLEANGTGDLVSLGPGPTQGRASGVQDASVGQLVAPSLRSRWTLVLGNTEERLASILEDLGPVDLYFYDNGPDPARARFELRSAWAALSPVGVLLAHHVDDNPAWREFCRQQGVVDATLDSGPPPMGALGMRSFTPA
ncbi:MAG: class I SAM-dependent methyltransferase [Thermoplasmata archaeon]|nr:class I SAM-dependent methyltransferase [Thermoplasmata archaeon]